MLICIYNKPNKYYIVKTDIFKYKIRLLPLREISALTIFVKEYIIF